jgi:hypothetical protein
LNNIKIPEFPGTWKLAKLCITKVIVVYKLLVTGLPLAPFATPVNDSVKKPFNNEIILYDGITLFPCPCTCPGIVFNFSNISPIPGISLLNKLTVKELQILPMSIIRPASGKLKVTNTNAIITLGIEFT